MPRGPTCLTSFCAGLPDVHALQPSVCVRLTLSLVDMLMARVAGDSVPCELVPKSSMLDQYGHQFDGGSP